MTAMRVMRSRDVRAPRLWRASATQRLLTREFLIRRSQFLHERHELVEVL